MVDQGAFFSNQARFKDRHDQGSMILYDLSPMRRSLQFRGEIT
jgi:hypothetical protein